MDEKAPVKKDEKTPVKIDEKAPVKKVEKTSVKKWEKCSRNIAVPVQCMVFVICVIRDVQ